MGVGLSDATTEIGSIARDCNGSGGPDAYVPEWLPFTPLPVAEIPQRKGIVWTVIQDIHGRDERVRLPQKGTYI